MYIRNFRVEALLEAILESNNVTSVSYHAVDAGQKFPIKLHKWINGSFNFFFSHLNKLS